MVVWRSLPSVCSSTFFLRFSTTSLMWMLWIVPAMICLSSIYIIRTSFYLHNTNLSHQMKKKAHPKVSCRLQAFNS